MGQDTLDRDHSKCRDRYDQTRAFHSDCAEKSAIKGSLAGRTRMYLLKVIYRDGSRTVAQEVGEEELIALVFDQLEKLQADRNVERITVKLKGDGEEVCESK